MRLRISFLTLFAMFSYVISAQFVGDAGPNPSSTPAAKKKATVTFKYGFAMPLSNYGITPTRSATPQYGTGVMGAKTGFFAEIGVGMDLGNSTNVDKKVGFYYYPIMLAYWKTSMDWSRLGGTFKDKAIYTKPISAIDIGQRYGVVVKPIKDLSIALYYRPGLIVPFDFDINNKTATIPSTFQFSGTSSTAKNAPVLTLSSTPGLSVRYMMAVISLEGYLVKPTYDVTYKDSNYPTIKSPATTKIPIRMFLLSLALSF